MSYDVLCMNRSHPLCCWTAGVLGLLLCGVLSGCGDSRPKVERGIVRGTVKFGDKPVTDGIVRFESAKGVSQGAELGPDGKYEVKTHESVGLPPDTYQVSIVPRIGPAPGEVLLVQEPPQASDEKEFPHIPPKVRDFATSGLSITVSVGENPAFDFDLSQ